MRISVRSSARRYPGSRRYVSASNQGFRSRTLFSIVVDVYDPTHGIDVGPVRDAFTGAGRRGQIALRAVRAGLRLPRDGTADGGPRVHPGVTGHRRRRAVLLRHRRPRNAVHLERDGRYALHAYPAESSDDEAYLAGRARPVTDEAARPALAKNSPRVGATSTGGFSSWTIEVAMVTHRDRPTSPPSTGSGARPDAQRSGGGLGYSGSSLAGVVQWQNISFPS